MEDWEPTRPAGMETESEVDEDGDDSAIVLGVIDALDGFEDWIAELAVIFEIEVGFEIEDGFKFDDDGDIFVMDEMEETGKDINVLEDETRTVSII